MGYGRTKIRGKNEKHKKEQLVDDEEEEEEGVKTKERFEGRAQDTHRGGLSKARLEIFSLFFSVSPTSQRKGSQIKGNSTVPQNSTLWLRGRK